MEKELFALLRLGLGNSTPEKENLSDFIMMTAEQWAKLGEKALGQGVLGIILDGIELLDATPLWPNKGTHQRAETRVDRSSDADRARQHAPDNCDE